MMDKIDKDAPVYAELRVITESFWIQISTGWINVEVVIEYEDVMRPNEHKIVRDLYTGVLEGEAVEMLKGSPQMIAEDIFGYLIPFPPNIVEVWVTDGMSRGAFVRRKAG